MAFPTILVNSAAGSDSAASGAGPGTALTGSNASTSGDGLTVTLDGSPSLAGVATDGSHVIYLADATAGARNFGKITGKDDTAKTVTVANAFGLSLSGKSWAIGGKRASISSTTSKKLFDNNSAAGDAMPGWIVEMQSGHSESFLPLGLRRAGDQTDGPITLRGESGAATKPLLTITSNANGLQCFQGYITLRDFELRNNNATKTASVGVAASANTVGLKFINLTIAHATDKFWKAISAGSANRGLIRGCEIANTASDGLTLQHTYWIVRNCTIHGCGGHGLVFNPGSSVVGVLTVMDCRIYANTGDGINRTNTGVNNAYSTTIDRNTIHGNGGDGIEWAPAGTSPQTVDALQITNNILSNNTGYGLNFSGASMTLEALDSTGSLISHNNTYGNSVGCNISGVLLNDPGLDPQFTDAANGDFRIGANLKAQGYPTANHLGLSYRSYVDIGAEQRQEVGGVIVVED